MPKVISGTPQVVATRLLHMAPDRNIEVQLTLKRVSGAPGATSRLSFIEECKAAGVWTGISAEPSESGGSVALLKGKPSELRRPIVTLEARESVLS